MKKIIPIIVCALSLGVVAVVYFCSDRKAPTINVFARAVVREKKIPFEIAASSNDLTRKDAINAFEELRSQAQRSSAKGMSMEEIDAEIHKARYGDGN